MHGRVTRALTAAVAAGATATTLGLTMPAAAQAATSIRNVMTGPVFVTDHAGYLAGGGNGWRFRWVRTTFTVPACDTPATSHGWTGNGAEIGASSAAWTAEISAGCDSGSGASVDFVTVDNGHVNMPVQLPMAPVAGTSLTVSIYYNRATGFVRFTVTDNTAGDTDSRTHLVGGTANYYGAEVGSQFGGSVSAPSADVRTGAFTGTALTAYKGAKGTLLGPWRTREVVATTSGTAEGAVIANAPVLWKIGANFGVWERTTA